MRTAAIIFVILCANYSLHAQQQVGIINDTTGDEELYIGYGQKKKSDVTESVSTIGEDQLSKNNSNMGEQLEGQASGLHITTTSHLGASMDVRIRGIHSIHGSSEPLWVIDGMPISTIRTVDDLYLYISPQDIKSIEVLKDARSCSMYGMQGANGVILIKTKNGKMNTKLFLS